MWRAAVLSSPFLSQDDKLQNKDAVVILTMSLVIVALSLYGVMAAALACFPATRGALGLAVTWSAGGLGVGGLSGFCLACQRSRSSRRRPGSGIGG
jgi:Zn-dependent protease with chaperone function